MLDFLLYFGASLIWGFTWLAIKRQLAQVPPILSVACRFLLASLILLAFCRLAGKRLNFSLEDHRFMVLQGFSLFGFSYIGMGYACEGLEFLMRFKPVNRYRKNLTATSRMEYPYDLLKVRMKGFFVFKKSMEIVSIVAGKGINPPAAD